MAWGLLLMALNGEPYMPITVLPLNRQKTLLDAVESIHKNIAVLQSGIANCHNLLSAIAGKELAALYKESV